MLNANSAADSEAATMQQLLPGWTDPVEPGYLSKVRRQIHRNPEPGWCEFETTALLARIFGDLGWKLSFGPEFIAPQFVRGRDDKEAERSRERAAADGVDPAILERMGGYPGLIAELDTGRPGKTLAVRFELDAIYIDEPADAEHIPAREGFASTHPGVMHACGHDGHLAAAAALGRCRGSRPLRYGQPQPHVRQAHLHLPASRRRFSRRVPDFEERPPGGGRCTAVRAFGA